MSTIGLGLNNILAKIAAILPDDSIAIYLSQLTTPVWVRYLNWFVPVTLLAEITKGWCLCIVAYRILVYAKRKGTSFFDVLTGNGE